MEVRESSQFQASATPAWRLAVPSLVTSLRLVCAGLMLFIGSEHLLLVTVFAVLTDYFDGYLARRLDVATRFGALFDPVADRIFVFCGLVALLNSELISIVAVALVFSREVFLATSYWVSWLNRAPGEEMDIRSGLADKLATTLQMLCVATASLSGLLATVLALLIPMIGVLIMAQRRTRHRFCALPDARLWDRWPLRLVHERSFLRAAAIWISRSLRRVQVVSARSTQEVFLEEIGRYFERTFRLESERPRRQEVEVSSVVGVLHSEDVVKAILGPSPRRSTRPGILSKYLTSEDEIAVLRLIECLPSEANLGLGDVESEESPEPLRFRSFLTVAVLGRESGGEVSRYWPFSFLHLWRIRFVSLYFDGLLRDTIHFGESLGGVSKEELTKIYYNTFHLEVLRATFGRRADKRGSRRRYLLASCLHPLHDRLMESGGLLEGRSGELISFLLGNASEDNSTEIRPLFRAIRALLESQSGANSEYIRSVLRKLHRAEQLARDAESVDPSAPQAFEILARAGLRKGGFAYAFFGSVVLGELTDAEFTLFFSMGAVFQLFDDFHDIDEDSRDGVLSIWTLALYRDGCLDVALYYLLDLVENFESIVREVEEQMEGVDLFRIFRLVAVRYDLFRFLAESLHRFSDGFRAKALDLFSPLGESELVGFFRELRGWEDIGEFRRILDEVDSF